MVAAVLYSARHLLTLDLQPWGDMAADMLLTRKISEDGYLLTGHYSRFGFSHPGPFFFYTNFVAEALFMPLGATLFGAWVLSSSLLNLVFVLLATTALAQLYTPRPWLAALAAAAVPLCLPGDAVFNPWMPYRLVLPYMAFFCCLLPLWQGRWRMLPLAVLLAGILIHGYVTLPLFTLVPLLLVCTYTWWRRTPAFVEIRRPLLQAAAIAVLFMLPIVLDFAWHPEGNLRRLLGAAKANAPPAADYSAALDLLGKFWLQLALLLASIALIALVVAVATRNRVAPAPLLPALALVLLISLLFVVYHASAPPPLHEFVAYFYRGVVCAVMAVLVLSALTSLQIVEVKNALAALVLVLVTWVVARNAVTPSVNEDHLRELSSALLQRPETPLRIDYVGDDKWPFAAGLVYNLRHAGADACVTRPGMDYLFTENATCPGPAQYLLVDTQACVESTCIKIARSLAIKKAF